jgi:hypothetical protein
MVLLMTSDLFRLNEGHTMFVERKITGRLHHDDALSQFMALGGAKELKEEIVMCAIKFHHSCLYTAKLGYREFQGT